MHSLVSEPGACLGETEKVAAIPFDGHDIFHPACFILLATQVRHLLKQGKSVEGMVGTAVARYIRDNTIAERVSGRQKWTVEVRHDGYGKCTTFKQC